MKEIIKKLVMMIIYSRMITYSRIIIYFEDIVEDKENVEDIIENAVVFFGRNSFIFVLLPISSQSCLII
jgi:hypothetical protein